MSNGCPWWLCPGIWLGALEVVGEGGNIALGPTNAGGITDVGATTVEFAHATGDFSVASVGYAVSVTTATRTAQTGGQQAQSQTSSSASPRVVSGQQGCTYTFKFTDTVSEGRSTHDRRRRKPRPEGPG